MRFGRALAVAALLNTAPVLAQPTPPRVEVTGGTVEGAAEDGLLVFQGIPFAAPPTGDRRWRAPAPPTRWSGTRAATERPRACPQDDHGWNRDDAAFADEDCLTLDIGTTLLDGRRPVIVWIHGGGNYAGAPTGMVRSSIVRRGVVMVGVRYRLGALGFLPHRLFAAETGGNAGNYALMDQVAALRWVRANIARFGGDPDNVTIAGESAGSQDVSLLLAAPAARGLFAKAAMESGTPGFGLPPRPLDEALVLGDQFSTLTGATTAAALRALPIAEVLSVSRRLHDPVLTADDYRWLRVTIDGAVLPESPDALLAEAPPRPVIIGSNRIELDLPGGASARSVFLRLSYGRRAQEVAALYDGDSPGPRYGTLDQRIATDATFVCPAGRLASLLAERDAPVWRYEFDIGTNGGLTTHAAEIGFIFGEQRAGGVHLQDYWLNFARTGDPNGAGLAAWPRYRPDSPRHILFDDAGGSVAEDRRRPICVLSTAL